MARVAIIHPDTLVGTELRQRLGETPADVTLLAEETEPGSAILSEYAGAAALVQEADAGALAPVELAFVCSEDGRVPELPFSEGTTVLHVGGGRAGEPLVAGVNAAAAEKGEVYYSPPAGLIACALQTQALRHLDTVSASAVVIDPVSTLGQGGIDELLDQTRATLGFGEQPTEHLGRQLAFLLVPGDHEEGALQATMARILDHPTPFSVLGLRGGVFHGVSCALRVEFSQEPSHSELIEAIEESRYLQWNEDPSVNQLEVAGSDQVVVSRIEPGGRNALWLWSLTDNLTRGAALNALDAARELHPDLLPPGLVGVG